MSEIEADTTGDNDQEHFIHSIAISLKRIADSLEILAKREFTLSLPKDDIEKITSAIRWKP